MNSRPHTDAAPCVYKVDRDGVIRWVNDAWLAFAKDNGWTVAKQHVVGSKLAMHIADLETRYLYALMDERVRTLSRALRFDYRCDSPDRRRFMRMEVMYDLFTDQVEYRSWLVREESRAPVPLLDGNVRHRSRDTINVCGWCKKVEVGSRWLEVERAVHVLGLFDAMPLPALNHVVCPICSKTLRDKILDPVRILVVDDNHLLATTLSEHLRSFGYAADAAFSAKTALQLCLHQRYEMVIADIVMPESDGISLLETLRQEGIDTRAIVMTGLPVRAQDMYRLEGLGIDEVIEKPFGFDDVTRSIRRHFAAGSRRDLGVASSAGAESQH